MRPSVMNFLLVAVLFFTCVVQYGAPMKCYKCDTEESCRDKPGNCTTNEGTKFCWKSEATKDGKKIVIKDCNEPPIGKASKSNKCESVKYEGVQTTFCICNSDFCNHANDNAISKLLLLSLTFVTISLKF